MYRNFLLFAFLFQITFAVLTAQETFTLSGFIKDADTGETLIGANLYNKDNTTQGAVSNDYGFYSLSIPKGEYQIVVSYLGYAEQLFDININENKDLDIALSEGITFKEVVVLAEDAGKNVESTDMGKVEIGMDQARKLPALLGEIDILKTLQLLPGVLSAGEGNSGFYVRGGGPDQNLVLLDEAIVYNSGHLLGFFSVFNADAIKNTTLIKGSMPANYGGRLSSVVDIQMKEGNDKDFVVEGGIGLLASRLTLQGPIQKEKSSFIISARRTYVFDLAQPWIKTTNIAGTNYYFYDLNTKINYRFSKKDRLYFSGYFGRDVLKYNSELRGFKFSLPYGNATATVRWNHLFNSRLFLNVSAIYNDYDFTFSGSQDQFSFHLFSGVRDWNIKADFDYFPSVKHKIKFGFNVIYHKLTPNVVSAISDDVEFSNDFKPKYAQSSSIYILDDHKINDRLTLHYGLRATAFSQLGPFTSPDSIETFKRFEPVKTYWGLEPRLSAKYSISSTKSFKAGIAVTNQYIHLVSNSTSTLPADVWVPSTKYVKPQIGIQYALGYFQNFANNDYETSIEVYYKQLKNQIDYQESYVADVTVDVESQFVFGKGWSYGLELFIKKKHGRLNGWIGYTLAKTERSFDDINEGKTFPATYDRRHDASLVLNYKINKKWDFGTVFVYGTGNSYTPIESLYFVEQKFNTNYGVRNSARIEPYHRVDLSFTLTPKPDSKKKFTSNWVFSVYNIYNRRNPFFIYTNYYTDLEKGEAEAKAYKVSLFPVIPSVTWNFKWKS